MKQNETKLSPKVDIKYYCDICDYYTTKKTDYVKHLSTRKHKIGENETKLKQNETDLSPKSPKVAKQIICDDCGVIFNSRTTLWRHKQKCKDNYGDNNHDDSNDNDINNNNKLYQ